jgi:PAS domain S-box-containing protein
MNKTGTGSNRFLKEECNVLLNSLFELSDDLLFILDADGIYTAVSEYGPAQFDFSPDEMVGKHFIDFISLSDRTTFSESFTKLIKEEQPVFFEISINSKYGKDIRCTVSAISFRKNKEISGVVGIVKNISDIRYCEKEIKELKDKLTEAFRFLTIERSRSQQRKSILEELNKLKSEFISNVSHELRTPLASIIGFSETIASDPDMEIEMRNEFVHIILNEGKRLAKLVNDILDVTKMEEGGIILNKTELNLKNLIERVVESKQELILKKNLMLSFEFPNEIVIFGDETRLIQVFTDILSNAIKFTERGGRISIFAQSLYKECEVIISDTGVGIPSLDLPHIFDKFYRVNRPGTEIPGTGLGLVLAKQIVDLHRGLITIQSEVDKGTSVIIKLPKHKKNQQI